MRRRYPAVPAWGCGRFILLRSSTPVGVATGPGWKSAAAHRFGRRVHRIRPLAVSGRRVGLVAKITQDVMRTAGDLASDGNCGPLLVDTVLDRRVGIVGPGAAAARHARCLI